MIFGKKKKKAISDGRGKKISLLQLYYNTKSTGQNMLTLTQIL